MICSYFPKISWLLVHLNHIYGQFTIICSKLHFFAKYFARTVIFLVWRHWYECRRQNLFNAFTFFIKGWSIFMQSFILHAVIIAGAYGDGMGMGEGSHIVSIRNTGKITYIYLKLDTLFFSLPCIVRFFKL